MKMIDPAEILFYEKTDKMINTVSDFIKESDNPITMVPVWLETVVVISSSLLEPLESIKVEYMGVEERGAIEEMIGTLKRIVSKSDE